MPKKKITSKQKKKFLVFYGKHKNISLAMKHARQLEKKHSATLVHIQRKTSIGRFSTHGNYFSFFLLPNKDEELNLEWLITIDYRQGKRRFHADLLIVAKADATPTELADQARKQLSKGKKFLANWVEGGFATISKGSFVDQQPSTRTRQFERYK